MQEQDVATENFFKEVDEDSEEVEVGLSMDCLALQLGRTRSKVQGRNLIGWCDFIILEG